MITKSTSDFSNLDFTAGEVILIDKPPFWSSYKIVHKVKKAIGLKKVGHAGTLDPMATGLLILCTGRKTKEIYKYQNLTKTYTGVITLGKTSPSMDSETEIIEGAISHEIDEKIINSVRNEFLGEIEQIPPMFSALKVNGRRLYQYARKDKTVERQPRKVIIEKFEINKVEIPHIHFKITCSKGTYIRVIANDFGAKLGCGGILTELRRTEIGEYSVQDALQIDDFISKAGQVQN
jgi:tRNA pseudouridine55 synthase